MKKLLLYSLFTLISYPAIAVEDRVELETTFIKGNKELPQVLYVVPWKDMKKEKRKTEIIVLHSLFGDTFEPVTPKKLGQ